MSSFSMFGSSRLKPPSQDSTQRRKSLWRSSRPRCNGTPRFGDSKANRGEHLEKQPGFQHKLTPRCDSCFPFKKPCPPSACFTSLAASRIKPRASWMYPAVSLFTDRRKVSISAEVTPLLTWMVFLVCFRKIYMPKTYCCCFLQPGCDSFVKPLTFYPKTSKLLSTGHGCSVETWLSGKQMLASS